MGGATLEGGPDASIISRSWQSRSEGRTRGWRTANTFFLRWSVFCCSCHGELRWQVDKVLPSKSCVFTKAALLLLATAVATTHCLKAP